MARPIPILLNLTRPIHSYSHSRSLPNPGPCPETPVPEELANPPGRWKTKRKARETEVVILRGLRICTGRGRRG